MVSDSDVAIARSSWSPSFLEYASLSALKPSTSSRATVSRSPVRRPRASAFCSEGPAITERGQRIGAREAAFNLQELVDAAFERRHLLAARVGPRREPRRHHERESPQDRLRERQRVDAVPVNIRDEARRDRDDGDDQTLAAADIPRRADDRSEVENRKGQASADDRV